MCYPPNIGLFQAQRTAEISPHPIATNTARPNRYLKNPIHSSMGRIIDRERRGVKSRGKGHG